MRSLKKNQSTYIACRYKKTEDVVDLQGYKTGEKVVRYYPPMTFKANISGAKGNVFVEVFGTDINYDKTISMSKSYFKQLKFDDNTVFFIEKKPAFKDATPLYDYRVLKIAETINEVVIAIKKV